MASQVTGVGASSEGEVGANAGAGDDVVWGNDGNDKVIGNEGNDTLSGGSQKDSIYGGDGNDRLNGGEAQYGEQLQKWMHNIYVAKATVEYHASARFDDMLDIAEPRIRPLELAAPFDIDAVRTVDEDIGDLFIVEKRLERTQADHVVGKFGR